VKRVTLSMVLVLLLAACGGGGNDVPADAVAVVDGKEIARSDYDALVVQVKKNYVTQKREFPKPGSREFQTLRNQFVQYLVQREQYEQAAADFDIEVTEKQVEARLELIQMQYFGGDKAKFEKQMAEQGVTDEQIHQMLVENPRRIFEVRGAY